MNSSPAHVLVVDDESHVCELIRDRLQSQGHQCQSVSEPQEAKQFLCRDRFDVLIADIQMPHVNGFDLLIVSRFRQPSCKVILISGQAYAENLERALRVGAYDYFQKPLEMEKLVQRVDAAKDSQSQWSYLAQRAARAIQMEDHAQLASLESVRALVHAVEAKDPYTRRHSEQVAHYATHLASYLGVPAAKAQHIRTAALLHDIGKIGVPDDILVKPGQLTAQEYAVIQKHPVLGAQILRNISAFSAEAELVHHHHERWDGGGYPDRLSGSRIPVGSRIINIADSMDAMLMHRTYKQAYPLEKMLEELHKGAGAQFDPDYARAAVSWVGQHGDKVILPLP